MSLTYQEAKTLEMLKNDLDSLQATSDTLDAKAQHNISVGGIVLALIILGNQGAPLAENPLLLLAVGLYAVSFTLSYLALRPQPWQTPFAGTSAAVKMMIDLDLTEYFTKEIIMYLDVIEFDAPIVSRKSRLVSAGSLLIGAIVVLAVVGVAA